MNAARLFTIPTRLSLALRAFAGNRLGLALVPLLGMGAFSYMIVHQTRTPAAMATGITDEKIPGASRSAVTVHAGATPGAATVASVEPGPATAVPLLKEEKDDTFSARKTLSGSGAESYHAVTGWRQESTGPGGLETSNSVAENGSGSRGSPAVTGVLHITNSGDRIIVSNEYDQVVSVFEAFGSEGGGVISAAEDAVAEPEAATAPADYEELYPGCPRTLPYGADEQMAAERLQYYGCRYRRSCSTATEEQEAVCTWYLTGKV